MSNPFRTAFFGSENDEETVGFKGTIFSDISWQSAAYVQSPGGKNRKTGEKPAAWRLSVLVIGYNLLRKTP